MTLPRATGRKGMGWLELAIVILLGLATCAAFWPVLHCKFTNYDDPSLILNNPWVRLGLKPFGLMHLLTSFEGGGYAMPLTFLSFRIDQQFFGLRPLPAHAQDLAFHVANAMLVFLFLRLASGSVWRSALAAALFALHPLRVESVAWVSERKDVLAGFFGLLCLITYVLWTRRRSGRLYLLALLLYLFSLLAKPMFTPMPGLLLLLDGWPLERLTRANWRRLALEKWPYLLLAIAAAVGAVVGHRIDFPGNSDKRPPGFATVLANAIVAQSRYFWKTIYPRYLSPNYPIAHYPLAMVASSLALLVAISALAWLLRRSHPWLLMGWLWWLMMMLPVSGIVQVGQFAMADRFTYLASPGLILMLVWSIPGTRRWAAIALPIGVAACVALGVMTFDQCDFWRDSLRLWTHAIAVEPGSYVAEGNLAAALSAAGRSRAALSHNLRAVELDPYVPQARDNLGRCYEAVGDDNHALAQFDAAIALEPLDAKAYFDRGIVLIRRKQWPQALEAMHNASSDDPNFGEGDYYYGLLLQRKGDIGGAIAALQQAVDADGTLLGARDALGQLLLSRGRYEEAMEQAVDALEQNLSDPVAKQTLNQAMAHTSAPAPPNPDAAVQGSRE